MRNAWNLCVWIGLLCCVAAVRGQDPSVTLDEAREQGRAASRFLNDRSQPATSDTETPKANVEIFHQAIGPVLTRSCLACHGPEKSEGRLRIDQLNPDLLHGPDAEKWREVFDAVSKSEMPPEGEADVVLEDEDRRKIVDWLSDELNMASRVRRGSEEHSSFRRLTNYEYNYVLRDLLGLPYALTNRLPPETASSDGFRNSSELLQMSAMQFELCREMALNALRRAVVIGDPPQPVVYRVSMAELLQQIASAKDAKTFERGKDSYQQFRHEPHLLNRDSGLGVRYSGGKTLPVTEVSAVPDSGGGNSAAPSVILALPGSRELKLDLDRFLPDEGTMHVRIRVGRSTMKPDEYCSLRLMFSAHTSNDANFSQVISEHDVAVTAPAENPQEIVFDIPLNDIQRNPFRKLTTTFPRRDEFLHIQNVSNVHGGEEPLQVQIES
ncbi:MAG: DUF1587 domain-containing protein, partial [Planctomycetaceae bacterium]|nr:DUF1587 domain-containing protein [Planctomycetaceae bacterium]